MNRPTSSTSVEEGLIQQNISNFRPRSERTPTFLKDHLPLRDEVAEYMGEFPRIETKFELGLPHLDNFDT